MSEPRYHIIFSTLIEGRQPEQVYHDLADLFKIEPELVQQIFACQGSIVKRDLDRATAEQYVQIILAAGAICVIEPMPTEGNPVAAATDVMPEEQDDTDRTEQPPDVENVTESYASGYRPSPAAAGQRILRRDRNRQGCDRLSYSGFCRADAAGRRMCSGRFPAADRFTGPGNLPLSSSRRDCCGGWWCLLWLPECLCCCAPRPSA